jgi:hypothetical protein
MFHSLNFLETEWQMLANFLRHINFEPVIPVNSITVYRLFYKREEDVKLLQKPEYKKWLL